MCILKFSAILRKVGQTRLNASVGHAFKFSGRTWYEVQIRERNGPSRGVIQKRWTSWAKSLRADVWGTNTWGNLTTRRVRPQSSMGFGEKKIYIYPLKAEDKAAFYLFSCENKGTGAGLQKHRRTSVCGWFGSFNAHAEQGGLRSDEMDGHFAEVQKPCDGSDRKWWSADKRGSTSVRSRLSICSSQCNHSKKRQQFYRLVSFAQNTDVHASGKNGEPPRLTKNGKTITCTMDNFVLLVVRGLSSSSSSSSVSTSRPKDHSNSSSESEASTDPMTTRRAKHACGKPMQTNSDMQTSGSRGLAHRKRDGRRGSNARHSWLVTALHRKSRGPGDACARTSLWKRSRIRKVMLQKWRHKNGSTVLRLTSPKTEIATYAWEPKLRGFLAEDAMRGLFIARAEKFGELMTADHKVLNERSESWNSDCYAIVVQDLATRWIQSYPCKNIN